MEKKNNKGIIILITIVILILSTLCILLATKTITFNNKQIDSDELSNSNENENNQIEWVNYLKNKNIIVKKSIWNTEKDECEFKSISLSSEQINKIIDELSNKKITKHYYGEFPPTGTICSNRFILKYENSEINLESEGYVWIDDYELSNKIDLDVDNTTYADNYKEDGYVYQFDINFANIFKDENNLSENITEEDTAENVELDENTKTEFKKIFNFVYDYYDSGNGYCGSFIENDIIETTNSSNANYYIASSEYSSFEEMIKSLKEYMTEDVIYEKKSMSSDNYVEKDGKLYCPNYGKGGNIYQLEDINIKYSKSLGNRYYTTIETKLVYNNIIDNEIHTINELYEVTFEKIDNKWIISSYKKTQDND